MQGNSIKYIRIGVLVILFCLFQVHVLMLGILVSVVSMATVQGTHSPASVTENVMVEETAVMTLMIHVHQVS